MKHYLSWPGYIKTQLSNLTTIKLPFSAEAHIKRLYKEQIASRRAMLLCVVRVHLKAKQYLAHCIIVWLMLAAYKSNLTPYEVLIL